MENISALLALCHRSPMTSPHKGQWWGPLIFFYLRLNILLSKQSGEWWFETPSGHYDVTVMRDRLIHLPTTTSKGLVVTKSDCQGTSTSVLVMVAKATYPITKCFHKDSEVRCRIWAWWGYTCINILCLIHSFDPTNRNVIIIPIRQQIE